MGLAQMEPVGMEKAGLPVDPSFGMFQHYHELCGVVSMGRSLLFHLPFFPKQTS
jgi:hypothetical protein